MGLPVGPAVTFLFTDIEGSTRLERQVGTARWAELVARHDRLLREAIEEQGGTVVKTEGDAFFAAFDQPGAAAAGAVAAQRAVRGEPWPDDVELRVRMGLHLGEGRLRNAGAPGDPEDYVGIDVNYAARIAAAANGGQIVFSDSLSRALEDDPDALAGLTGVRLVDEGLRAVKDFEEPARLHRLVVDGVADDARRLRTLDPPTNLPGDVTALIGRDAEIASTAQALSDSRIVTLTGPGGSGKTRLALAAARSVMDRFPHGTWFVDLEAMRDPRQLESAIATAIGVRESADHPIGEALRSHLRDRSVLLVLDNLEQLLPDAAETVSRLARAAPQLRLLVTSRELLRIAGERGYPVPPLDAAAGIALFEERARLHRPDLEFDEPTRATVHAICERLAYLPLAIELAAAQVRTQSPAAILEHLGRTLDLATRSRDLPERQRTLRGAISWSHELLAGEERMLFRRLGVFAGGWTLDEAGPVANGDGDLGMDLAEGLAALADKSLVRVEPLPASATPDDEVRFGLHPLLREFALERLDEAGERAATEARHAAVMTDLALAVGGQLLGATGDASLRRLDREAYNLQRAVEWSVATGTPSVGLRIMGSTWRWYQQRGRLREGRALLDRLLAMDADGDARTRIEGLTAAGGLAYWMDDPAGARAAYEERLELALRTADDVLVADAHYDLGFTAMVAKDGAALRSHEQRALELYLAAGREDGAIRARQALVLAEFLAGNYEAARALEADNLAAFRRRDSRTEVADSLVLTSAIDSQLGDVETGWSHVVEGLAFFGEHEMSSGIARAMAMAAILQLEHGDIELGARIAGATHELAREQHVMLAPVKVLHLPDPAILATERLGEGRAAELLAIGAGTPLDQAIAEVLAAPSPSPTTAAPAATATAPTGAGASV